MYADVHVNGYYRTNGTYVQSYYRTSPDSTVNNNYSTVGNINPYTGREGTKPRDINESGYYKSSTIKSVNYCKNTVYTSAKNYAEVYARSFKNDADYESLKSIGVSDYDVYNRDYKWAYNYYNRVIIKHDE